MSQYRAYFVPGSVDPTGLQQVLFDPSDGPSFSGAVNVATGLCPDGWDEISGPGPLPYQDLYEGWRDAWALGNHIRWGEEGSRLSISDYRYHFYDFEWEKGPVALIGCGDSKNVSVTIDVNSSEELSGGALGNIPIVGEAVEASFGYSRSWGSGRGTTISTPEPIGGDPNYKYRVFPAILKSKGETQQRYRKYVFFDNPLKFHDETNSEPFWWNTTVYWEEFGMVVCRKCCGAGK